MKSIQPHVLILLAVGLLPSVHAAPWRIAIDTETTGFDREMIRAASRIGNGDLQFVQVSSKLQGLEKLASGEVDAAAGIPLNLVSSGMPVVFSSGYRVGQIRAFAHEDSKLRGVSDIGPEMNVVARQGTAAFNYAKTRGWNVVGVPSTKAALGHLLRGESEVLLGDRLEAESEIAKTKLRSKLKQLPDPLPSSMLTVAVSNSNLEWLRNFNSGLHLLERSGHREMLQNRWNLENRNADGGLQISMLILGVLLLLLAATTILFTKHHAGRRSKFPVPTPPPVQTMIRI